MTSLLEYCNVKSSSFPVNLSRLCVVAIFMKNKDNVKAYCQTEVTPNSLLSKATYVFDGIWIITMQAELSFSIGCKNYTKVMLPKPPMSVLSLEMEWSASNDYMTLMLHYHKESTYSILDIYSELIQLNNKSQTKLWNASTSRLPNFTKIDIPDHLKAPEKIPVGHLIETLHGLKKIEKDNGNPDWVYFVIGAVIVLLVVIADFIYYKKGKYIKQLCSAKKGGKLLTHTAPLVYHPVSVKSGDGTHIQRDTSSPQQGENQQQEDQVSKPLIHPVTELAKTT